MSRKPPWILPIAPFADVPFKMLVLVSRDWAADLRKVTQNRKFKMS